MNKQYAIFYLVGTGTSVRPPSVVAWARRTKATKGLLRKSTSPTRTLDASASRGIFFMNLFFSYRNQRQTEIAAEIPPHIIMFDTYIQCLVFYFLFTFAALFCYYYILLYFCVSYLHIFTAGVRKTLNNQYIISVSFGRYSSVTDSQM